MEERRGAQQSRRLRRSEDRRTRQLWLGASEKRRGALRRTRLLRRCVGRGSVVFGAERRHQRAGSGSERLKSAAVRVWMDGRRTAVASGLRHQRGAVWAGAAEE